MQTKTKEQLDEFFLVVLLAKFIGNFIAKHIRQLDFEAFEQRGLFNFGIKIPSFLYPVLKSSKIFGKFLTADYNTFDMKDGRYVQLNEFVGRINDIATITSVMGMFAKNPKMTKTSLGKSPDGDSYGLRLTLPVRRVPRILLSKVKRLPFFTQETPGEDSTLGFMNNDENKRGRGVLGRLFGRAPRLSLPPGVNEKYEFREEDLESVIFTPEIWNDQFGHNVIIKDSWVPLDKVVDWKEFKLMNEEISSIKANILAKLGTLRFNDSTSNTTKFVKNWHQLKYCNDGIKQLAMEYYIKNITDFVDETL